METATVHIDALEEFAAKFAANLNGGEVVALIGDLGAGKTTFTKALLKARGIKKRITSPTFGIIAPHEIGGLTFNHIDLYRIESAEEFEALGISQNWHQPDSVYIIEWADKIAQLLPKGSIIINFSVISGAENNTSRKISITHK